MWNDEDLDSPNVEDKAGFISKGHLNSNEDSFEKIPVAVQINTQKGKNNLKLLFINPFM
tara:strand:- start:597 stop:773 length:177 start_codon:yes stop_codon:yes gene_type:complete